MSLDALIREAWGKVDTDGFVLDGRAGSLALAVPSKVSEPVPKRKASVFFMLKRCPHGLTDYVKPIQFFDDQKNVESLKYIIELALASAAEEFASMVDSSSCEKFHKLVTA